MKRCPECRRDYYDETLIYCLDDGTALLEGPGSMDEPATALLHDTASTSEAYTRAQLHTTTPESDPARASSDNYVERARRAWAKPLALVAGIAVLLTGAFLAYKYIGPANTRQIQSLAVLPFANESGNPEYEYLSDGLTEALINNLSRLPDLSVKARSSVFSYKGKTSTPQQVGSELSVHAVLNGRVMQRGENLAVSVELVDARTGDQIWGEQYNRKLVDLTTLQSELARDVSRNLAQKLTSAVQRQFDKNPTADPEAYQLYLKGMFHWNRRTTDDLTKAIEYFTQAKEKDPSFALAYVGLAITYAVMPSNTALTREQTSDAGRKAKAAALRALELDNSLAEAHAVLANQKMDEWDFAGGENEFKRAIELNPNYATAYQWYSDYLARLGRHDEAIAAITRAYELDPFSVAVNMNLGLRYVQAGRVEEASAQFKKTIDLAPDYPMAYWFLGDIYFEKGMYEESLAMGEKGNVLIKLETPESAARKTAEIRQAMKTEGTKGYWRKILEYEMEWYEKNQNSPVYVATAYAALGENDKAFEWLEKAYTARDPELSHIKVNGRFKNIRSDPRYHDLLRRIGLPAG